MSFWNWLSMKIRRKHIDTVGDKFDKMVEAERQNAVEARSEASEERRQATRIRAQSWYLHGEFERAKTADPFSEFLMGNNPRTQGGTQ